VENSASDAGASLLQIWGHGCQAGPLKESTRARFSSLPPLEVLCAGVSGSLKNSITTVLASPLEKYVTPRKA